MHRAQADAVVDGNAAPDWRGDVCNADM